MACVLKDHVILYEEPHNVHITRELPQATREAHQAYGKKAPGRKRRTIKEILHSKREPTVL